MTADTEGRPQSALSAGEKLMTLLEALALGGEPQLLGDLAIATGIAKPSLHRLLAELAQSGFAVAHGAGRYSCGPRLFALATAIVSHGANGHAVEQYLRNVAVRLGQTIHFSARSGDEAVYVYKFEPPRAYEMASRVGSRFPLYSTATGKVLLAWAESGEAERYLETTSLPARTRRTITSPADLRREIAAVRRQGFALDDQENEDGVRCVAVPVLGAAGQVLGGISVSSLAVVLSGAAARDLVPELQAASRRLSDLLNGRAGALPCGGLADTSGNS